MGDWNLLGGILEEVHIHSTIVGKIWLTILFIFRMLVLGVAAEDVWDDEQSEFVCNTEQPGCKNVCYDQAFPISLIRYWVLQIIFVSSPSLVYMGHALYRLRALDKERHRKKVVLKAQPEGTDPVQDANKRIELKRLDEQKKLRKAPLRGSLLRTYIFHILTRSVVEVGFIIGQCAIYGIGLSPLYKCERLPCPNSVDCFVSRPTEKNIFMIFMLVIAGVSLFLNLLEIFHLGVTKMKRSLYGYQYRDDESLSRSKETSLVQQVCMLGKSSPQGMMQVSHAAPCSTLSNPLSLAPGPQHQGRPSINNNTSYKAEQLSRQSRLQSHADIQGLQLGAPGRRFTLEKNRNNSCSSDESNVHPRCSAAQPRPSLAAGHMEMPHGDVLRNLQRKYSKVKACKDLSDLSDSADSVPFGPFPTARKASFMSRGMSEPNVTSSSMSGDTQSGKDIEAQRLSQGESPPMSPPPPTRRMSMILELSSIMHK